MRPVQPFERVSGDTYPCQNPAKPRVKSHPSLQCHNWPDWVADGAVWSYPVSSHPVSGKGILAIFGVRDRTFGRARGWGNVAKTQRSPDAHSVLSCFFTVINRKPPRAGPRTSHRRVLVPSRNRICFNQIFYIRQISTSWTLERGPCPQLQQSQLAMPLQFLVDRRKVRYFSLRRCRGS